MTRREEYFAEEKAARKALREAEMNLAYIQEKYEDVIRNLEFEERLLGLVVPRRQT